MVSAAAGGRIRCCIPGCGRSFKRAPGDDDGAEVMCRRHWCMADARLRDRHKQIARRRRRIQRIIWGKNLIPRRARSKVYVFCQLERQGAKAWAAIKEDVTIKAALGAEDAPRRRPR